MSENQENTVIKHYKKRLIFRQHDDIPYNNQNKGDKQLNDQIKGNHLYEFLSEHITKENGKLSNNNNNGKKVRRKRKNRNCRGQFRHEAMELIKLGTSTPSTLCKAKEILNSLNEKIISDANSRKDQNLTTPSKQIEEIQEMSNNSIKSDKNLNRDAEIRRENIQLKSGRSLPQMVPERRNSKEIIPNRTVSLNYKSPPHIPSNTNPISSTFPSCSEPNRISPISNEVRKTANATSNGFAQPNFCHPVASHVLPINPPVFPHPVLNLPQPPINHSKVVAKSPSKVPQQLINNHSLLSHPNNTSHSLNKFLPYPTIHPPHPFVPFHNTPIKPFPQQQRQERPELSSYKSNQQLSPPPYSKPRPSILPPPYPILPQPPPYPSPVSPPKSLPSGNVSLHRPYTGGFRQQVLPPPMPLQKLRSPQPLHIPEPLRAEKRKHSPDDTSSVAIDLTVDHNHNEKISSSKHHKCHCECGKTIRNEPVAQEVIIKVPSDAFQDKEVPSILFKGKVVNGVLQLENVQEKEKVKKKPEMPQVEQNPSNVVLKPKASKKNIEQSPALWRPVPSILKDEKTDNELTQLESIRNQSNKKSEVPRPTTIQINEGRQQVSNRTIAKPNTASLQRNSEKIISPNKLPSPKIIVNGAEDKVNPPMFGGVIVSNKKKIESPRQKSQDDKRRQSMEVDTISISSSSNDSVKSSKLSLEKQIPKGKLFYLKNKNSFIRYFDETQKKLFINNLIADGTSIDLLQESTDDGTEVITFPSTAAFSPKDNLSVEEYVEEMILVENYVPKDFFLFYKFVTGYQICKNNLPVSFLTFLNIYNTNGLKDLLDRYINCLNNKRS